MKRLKVVRVYKHLRPGGGIQSRLLDLLPRLAERVDVRVLCYRERGGRARELEDAGVPVDLIPLGSKWAPWNTSRYAAYFRQHSPDVVHTHEYTANTLGITAAARAGVPVRIRHVHTMSPFGEVRGLRARLRRRADRRCAGLAHATLAVSRAVRARYLEASALPADACRVLYNGIDVARFEDARAAGGAVRREWGIPEAAPLVGVVSRITAGKGHDGFLAVAARLAKRIPLARFAVVGGGDAGPLEAEATALGLGGRVLFAGHRSDVPAVLGAFDLFLFPSRSEGLPGAVIEAQAAGVPVVGYRLPSMEEVVDDGRTGALVAPGDVEALAGAALGLLEVPDALRRAGAAARESARRFSLERCVEETLALYEDLTSRFGGKGTA